jgi:UMP-CMP kinase
VPTKITCGLIKKTMDSYGKDKIFLIDGYPRNLENWEGFKEVFGNDFRILATLYLYCEENICVDRLLSRGQSSGRIDDESAVIKKRFNTFYNESLSVLDELKKERNFINVDSTRTPEEVEKEVSNHFGNILNL